MVFSWLLGLLRKGDVTKVPVLNFDQKESGILMADKNSLPKTQMNLVAAVCLEDFFDAYLGALRIHGNKAVSENPSLLLARNANNLKAYYDSGIGMVDRLARNPNKDFIKTLREIEVTYMLVYESGGRYSFYLCDFNGKGFDFDFRSKMLKEMPNVGLGVFYNDYGSLMVKFYNELVNVMVNNGITDRKIGNEDVTSDAYGRVIVLDLEQNEIGKLKVGLPMGREAPMLALRLDNFLHAYACAVSMRGFPKNDTEKNRIADRNAKEIALFAKRGKNIVDMNDKRLKEFEIAYLLVYRKGDNRAYSSVYTYNADKETFDFRNPMMPEIDIGNFAMEDFNALIMRVYRHLVARMIDMRLFENMVGLKRAA